MTFVPNNSNVTGWIWVPNGRLTYGGNSASQGFYEAFDISIQGNSFDIPATARPASPVTTHDQLDDHDATTIPGTTTGPDRSRFRRPGVRRPATRHRNDEHRRHDDRARRVARCALPLGDAKSE